MLEAVIFDLDGVITDTAEYHYLAWKNLAEKIDVSIDREFNEKLKGISRMDSLDEILKHGKMGNKFSEAEKIEMAHSKNEEYKILLENLSPEDTYPGILELLDNLREQKIKIGLASASKNAPVILDKLGLNSYFEIIVNPDEVADGKPAPDIFLKAAEYLDVNVQNCIGIEDAIAGIKSIKSAEMFAVGVGDKELLKDAGANITFDKTNNMTLDVLLETFNSENIQV